jgi:hypothetical protein
MVAASSKYRNVYQPEEPPPVEEGATEQDTLEIQVAYGEAEAQRQKLHQEVKNLRTKHPQGIFFNKI